MAGVPLVLLAEVRVAFQSCSRQCAAGRRSQFSTFRPALKNPRSAKQKEHLPIQVIHSQLQPQPQTKPHALYSLPKKPPVAKDLVPVSKDGKALDTGRKVEVPMKVIPKAELTPNLTLSPKERLQIEQLTRRLPPRTEPKGRHVDFFGYHGD